MKITHQEEHTLKYTIIDETLCDRCGRKIENREPVSCVIAYNSSWQVGVNWEVEELCVGCTEWLKDILIKNGVRIHIPPTEEEHQ